MLAHVASNPSGSIQHLFVAPWHLETSSLMSNMLLPMAAFQLSINGGSAAGPTAGPGSDDQLLILCRAILQIHLHQFDHNLHGDWSSPMFMRMKQAAGWGKHLTEALQNTGHGRELNTYVIRLKRCWARARLVLILGHKPSADVPPIEDQWLYPHRFSGCTRTGSVAVPAQDQWLYPHRISGCTRTGSVAVPAQDQWLYPHRISGCTRTGSVAVPAQDQWL
ncbi:hypothetical protein NQZ68_008708 [Dissostichus eleginoides]|nr:hypothetical protein NQZ68_008708 [Dissostichus eleginoides]